MSTPRIIEAFESPGQIIRPQKCDTMPVDPMLFNAQIAALVLRDRVPRVCVNEIAQDILDHNSRADAIDGTPIDPGSERLRSLCPYHSLWLESRLRMPNGTDIGMGLLVETFATIRDWIGIFRDVDDEIRFAEDLLQDAPEHERRLHRYTMYLRLAGGDVVGPVAVARVVIGANYRVAVREDGNPAICVAAAPVVGIEAFYQSATASYATAIAIRTLGLMNASNIELVEGGHTNDDRTERDRRKLRLPWIKYHVLKIRVGKELRPIRPTGIEEARDARPLSFVRGHFKHYGGPDRGKHFGKFDRVVWCPAHMRGHERAGVVIKDYQMESAS